MPRGASRLRFQPQRLGSGQHVWPIWVDRAWSVFLRAEGSCPAPLGQKLVFLLSVALHFENTRMYGWYTHTRTLRPKEKVVLKPCLAENPPLKVSFFSVGKEFDEWRRKERRRQMIDVAAGLIPEGFLFKPVRTRL